MAGSEDRAAPVVTITDPRRPAAADDVLVSGDERAPWRAKRWHYELLAVLLALGLAVVVPQQVVSARAADHRAAVAAVDNARVSVSLADGEGPVRAIVTDDGPGPLTVLSLRLDADGYRAVHLSRTVASNRAVQVAVPDTRACTTDLVNDVSSGRATVQFRVAGQVVTRSVEATADLWEAARNAAQTRCGYLPASKALGVTATVRPVGAAQLELALGLTNSSKLPLLVNNAYASAPGLEALPGPASVVLPPGGPARAYRLRLKISNCGELLPAVDGGGLQIQLDVVVQVTDRSSIGGQSVEVTERVPALAGSLGRLIVQHCRST